MFTSRWLFTHKNFSIKIEYYILHILAVIFCCTLVNQIAEVRRKTLRLYQLSASCMALDIDKKHTGPDWVAIMRHYYPVPLNSFVALDSEEISTLFAVKIMASLFSGMFVASTFYNR